MIWGDKMTDEEKILLFKYFMYTEFDFKNQLLEFENHFIQDMYTTSTDILKLYELKLQLQLFHKISIDIEKILTGAYNIGAFGENHK